MGNDRALDPGLDYLREKQFDPRLHSKGLVAMMINFNPIVNEVVASSAGTGRGFPKLEEC